MINLFIYVWTGIYMVAWCVGFSENLMFRRFMRKNHPEMASIYFPRIFEGSIRQQFMTAAWIWKRKYVEMGDAVLVCRADMHRRISYFTLILLLITLAVLYMSIPRIAHHDKASKDVERVDAPNP